MGRGRHALLLGRAGYRTFGVDIAFDLVREAMAAAASERVALQGWCADLTQHPLPDARFDLIVVCRYLQRDLFAALRAACAPRGIVLYETFTTAQLALGSGPKSPEHLLRPGELRERFDGFEELFYEETTAPEAVARIVARRF
jgi:SAM-dependent methyltransferase